MDVIYHRLINKDLKTVLAYYEEEGGEKMADRFFAEVDIGLLILDPVQECLEKTPRRG